MISSTFAHDFAESWIRAFNSRDIEKIFELYDDNFIMESPYIRERMNIESGLLQGKPAVRPYWEKSLAQNPPIFFRPIEVFVGVSSVVIFYESVGRKLVCETFKFNGEGKVVSGCSQHGRPTG